MAMFGAGNALVPSSDATNCTCLAGNNAGSSCDSAVVCKFGNTAPVRTTDDFCQLGATTQDQISALIQRYGIRL
jgi:hypothetical protein